MATKKAKATTKKVELKDTLAKITSTAKEVNTQIVETASIVAEEVYESGKQWTVEATESAKKAIQEIDLNKGIEQVKTSAKNINSKSLEVAETLLDGAFENGKEWQGVAEKAIKGGLQLADKQQDIIFDTLDSVKDQMLKSAKRFKVLFSKN